MVHSIERRSFDWPGALLARLAPKFPLAAYRAAATIGSMRQEITARWPSAAEVRALLPQHAKDAPRIASQIAALHERNRLMVRTIIRGGLAPVRPLMSVSERLAALDEPAILVSFHVGALQASGAALEQLRRPVLAFRQGTLIESERGLTVESTGDSEQARAASLHRAVVHLREGGIVFLALDDVPGPAVSTQCLGRSLELAPGAFALARWTGAPIIPSVTYWQPKRVRMTIGDPIASPDEASMWLERYVSERPSELSLGLLRKLLGVS
jgi:lauroyl/myristoyl acyltransferase